MTASTLPRHQPTLEDQVVELLRKLAVEQNRMAAIYAQRQRLLATNTISELEELSALEAETIANLHQIRLERAELLKLAQQEGLAVTSLGSLVACWKNEELSFQVQALTEQAQQLEQEKIVQELLLKRSKRHYTDLAGLVARRGRKEVTYNPLPTQTAPTGVLFDATA